MTSRSPGKQSAARRLLLLPLAALIAVTGCAVVPTGGPVMKGMPVEPEDPAARPPVRVIPNGPQTGWTPKKIVRGFLKDSASFQNDHEAARQYLAPTVRTRWDPGSGVQVYAHESGFDLLLNRSSKHDAVVTIKADRIATISARGQYTAASPDARLTARFRLRTIGGEWRIVGFPQGLLLSEGDVHRAYRTFNLYFFERRLEVLVPNPIHVPLANRGGVATELVRNLIRGATDWLAPAVRNPFPEGTSLVEPVKLKSSIATVNLGGTALAAGSQTLARMSAQLAWTLEQLPDVDSVRLKLGGETVDVSEAGQLMSTEDWASMDPGATSGTVHGYVVRDEKLLVTAQNGLQPAPGPAGSAAVSVHDPAISLDGRHAAWLSGTGDTLFVSQLREGGQYWPALRGDHLVSLSWDRYGNLWAVEDGGKGSTIWMLVGAGEPVRVDVPALEDREVHGLRVSRDGTRVAVIVSRGGSSEVMLGRIERNGSDVRVGKLTRLLTGLVKVTDVAWRDADTLAVLGKDVQGTLLPYTVDVDGTTVSTTGAAIGKLRSIAAAPDVPTLVGLRGGEIYESREDLTWERLGSGAHPVYPG